MKRLASKSSKKCSTAERSVLRFLAKNPRLAGRLLVEVACVHVQPYLSALIVFVVWRVGGSLWQMQ